MTVYNEFEDNDVDELHRGCNSLAHAFMLVAVALVVAAACLVIGLGYALAWLVR